MDWRKRWRIAWYVLFGARTLWHVAWRVDDEMLAEIVKGSQQQGDYSGHQLTRDGHGGRLLILAEHNLSSITVYGDRGEACAELRLSFIEGNYISFALEMDPRYINRGIGSKLMEWTFEALSERYPEGVVIGGVVFTHDPETDDDQRRRHFYTKLGFEVVEREARRYCIKRAILGQGAAWHS